MKIKILREKWKWRWSWSVRSTLVLCLTGFFLISIYAEVVSKEIAPENEKISLTEALYRISVEYQVFFSYDQEAVQDVVVFYEPDRYENVEHALDRMLTGTSLHYRVFNNRYIILYESHPEAINSLKDMVQHLESVIDKEDKASTPRKNLTVSTLPPRSSVFLVQPLAFSVSGTVTDQEGEPLIGVNIQVKGTDKGTSTDFDGSFSLEDIHENAVLVISYVGYQTLEVEVAGKTNLEIVMTSDSQLLDEVVVVGYGTQKKASVIGAITNVSPETLLRSSHSRTISNSLAGNMAGVIAIQRSGEPGYDASDFWIRGVNTFGAKSDPLVLIDGVERNLNDISPDEIASFSILKDATATAVYGVRGANGVILIQTRRGKVGKTRISARAEYGISEPTQIPSFVDGAKYMEIINEARELSGLEPSYTQSDIEKTRTQMDPDFFPDINWLDVVTNRFAYNQRVSTDINGGTDLLRYSLIVSYFGEKGIIDIDPNNNYDSKLNLDRYNVRSNVDINLTPSTILNIGIGGYIQNRNSPGSVNNILSEAFNVTPVIHPVKYSNGQIASRPNGSNPWVLATQSGYSKDYRNKLESTVSISQEVGELWESLDGLELKGLFSFDAYNISTINRNKTPSMYQIYGRDDEGEILTNNLNEGQEFLGYGRSSGGERSMYVETQLNYSKDFLEEHTIEGLLLYNAREYVNLSSSNAIGSLPYRNQGLAGRLSYSYKYRYFTEINFGYNGSENFNKGYRFGFFPSVAVGWMISEEPFMKDLSNVISFLKLRGSWGKVGNDVIGGRRFAYIPTIGSTSGYSWGYTGQNSRSGVREDHFGIPDLTWETANKINVGFELGIASNILLQADIFREYRKNIFMERKTIPATSGYNRQPYANFGIVRNKGIDMSIDMDHRFSNDLVVSIRGNFTHAVNKVIEFDESESIKNTTRAQTGQSLNQHFGLIAIGLYTDEDFVEGELRDELPRPSFGTVNPGDIKYLDINNDGKIDALDISPIGKPWIPETIYGFGINTIYKNFDLGVFFQGAGNLSNMLKGDNFIPGSGGGGMGNIYSNVDDRWTPDNPRQDVFWPRLSITKNENNEQSSTWWLRDDSYIRLKNVEFGYSMSQVLEKQDVINNLRVFFRGSNLFTHAKFDMWDPEIGSTNGLTYPPMRIYSFGLEVLF